jgi:hypothetical protein
MERKMTRTTNDARIVGRRRFIAASAAALAVGVRTEPAKAQSATGSHERALSAYFASLPQNERRPNLVERLAFGDAEYDLGWWAPAGRTYKYRSAVLLRGVNGIADLHLVLPASHPSPGQEPPRPPAGVVAQFDGSPQSRLPKGVALAWRSSADANPIAEGFSYDAFAFMIDGVAKAHFGAPFRSGPIEIHQLIARVFDHSERVRGPVSGVLDGPRPGTGVEIQLGIRRRHFVADVFGAA